MPTISAKKSGPKKGLQSKRAMERETLYFLVAIGAGSLTLILHLAFQLMGYMSEQGALDLERRAVMTERVLILANDLEIFEEERKIAETAQEENLAAKARAREFEERSTTFKKSEAHTGLETRIAEMSLMAGDTSVPAPEALEKLGKLAAPADDRVNVLVKDRNGSYRVEIAYPCPAVKDTSLYSQWPEGYYREVRMTTAGIVKDVFRFGSDRGISSMLVTCVAPVTISSGAGKKKTEYRHQFMVELRPGGVDWQSITRNEVPKHWRVKKDLIKAAIRGR